MTDLIQIREIATGKVRPVTESVWEYLKNHTTKYDPRTKKKLYKYERVDGKNGRTKIAKKKDVKAVAAKKPINVDIDPVEMQELIVQYCEKEGLNLAELSNYKIGAIKTKIKKNRLK